MLRRSSFTSLVPVFDRARLRRDLAATRETDALLRSTVFTLAATPAARADSKVTVIWQQDVQTGIIKVTKCRRPIQGKSTQLWAIDAGHREPVSAGIVRVDASGVAQIRFKPLDSTHRVKSFAISLERVGGAPKKEGPILFAGAA